MGIKLQVNLKAIQNNYSLIQARASKSTVSSVVKANAYGLGVKEVSLALQDVGCKSFFVATIDEAIELRKYLPDSWIGFFHGISNKEQVELCRNYKLVPVINDLKSLEIIDDLRYILHIDTGMNRLGIDANHLDKLAKYNLNQSNIEYIMTHPACADILDHEVNKLQYDKFIEVAKFFPNTKKSYANSFAIFASDKYHFDMVRPGCSLYGINPTPYMKNSMQNVVYLTSKILQIRHIDRDSYVGYGAEGFAKKGSILATIGFGYADGCMRSVKDQGFCAIDGIKFPIIGRVSMDLIVIDITNCKREIKVGEEVEIIGNNITVDDFANFAGTIGYEIITRLGSRVVRCYLK